MKLKAEELIRGYLKGESTPEERQLVEQGFNRYLETTGETVSQEEVEQARERTRAVLLKHIHVKKPVVRLWQRLAAAAAVLLLATTAIYFWQRESGTALEEKKFQADFAPASHKAILTLASGKQIVLNAVKSGRIAIQSGASVNKTAEDGLAYQRSAEEGSMPVGYNTVRIPRGGRQFHLTLADGTNVWLNAASAIKYPTSFQQKERVVEMNGEAYFEVAHDVAHPFKVISGGQTVKVLGTHFNIKAYDDELPVRTTLIQGKVEVSSTDGQQIILSPGQQATFNGSFQQNSADLDEVLSWRNNEFYFNRADLRTVLLQLGRWYDVDINYQNNFPKVKLTGSFSRDISADKALRLIEYLLETSKVKFKTERRTITVE